MLAGHRELETPKNHDCGGTEVKPAPLCTCPPTPTPPCYTDEQPQARQAAPWDCKDQALEGLVRLEAHRRDEVERRESGKEKEGKAAGLEHLTQLSSVLTNPLLRKLKLA